MPRRVFCLFLRCLPVWGKKNGQLKVLFGSRGSVGRGKRTLLSAGLLDLGGLANADQSVVGLELLHRLGGIVDESEAGGLATTELCPETENVDLLLVGLVHASQLLTEIILGDVGTAGVKDVTAKHEKDIKSAKGAFPGCQTIPRKLPFPCPPDPIPLLAK